MTNPGASDLLGVQELADYLGVSTFTIYRWNSNGLGPKRLRVGNKVLYRQADVGTWLDRHAVTAPCAGVQ